jgi:hypothetical protein
MGRTEHDD